MVAFVAQIAGRLVDLRWHSTHEGFEGGVEQLEAHWLIWIATLLAIWIASVGVRAVTDARQRRGYWIVLGANLAYAAVAVVHFFQHLDRLEVGWAHFLLAVTNAGAAVGVIWVVGAWRASRPPDREAPT